MTAPRAAVFRSPAGRVVGVLLAALMLTACSGDAAPDATPAAGASTDPGAPSASAAPAVQLPQGNLEAVALELGVVLDAEGRVATPSERVRAGDAVHVSLVTVGEAQAAMLAVRWRDAAGAEIDADERAITAEGPAVHTFTRKPEGGWAPGRYEVEVTMDGESTGVRAFEVR